MARNKKQKRLPGKPNPTTVRPRQDSHLMQIHERHEFTGPLPPPSILAEYNTTVPGAADRIIAMAEQQSLHRRSLEKKIVYSGSRDSILGLIFGLIIGLATIIGGCICVIFGHGISGSVISLSGLSGLVGVFVYGSKQRTREKQVQQ